MALTLDLTNLVSDDELVSDKRRGGDRHSEWADKLGEVAQATIDGVIPEGKFVKLAEFAAASGARARIKVLEDRELPCGEYGRFEFKPITFLGLKDENNEQRRQSSLWVKFVVTNWPEELDEAEYVTEIEEPDEVEDDEDEVA